MNMSKQGPTVSFKGSPTVSPITAASWAGEPFSEPSIAPVQYIFTVVPSTTSIAGKYGNHNSRYSTANN